jgi:hypothetical protein
MVGQLREGQYSSRLEKRVVGGGGGGTVGTFVLTGEKAVLVGNRGGGNRLP